MNQAICAVAYFTGLQRPGYSVFQVSAVQTAGLMAIASINRSPRKDLPAERLNHTD